MRVEHVGGFVGQEPARDVGPLLTPPGRGHPWIGHRFSAGWGARDVLEMDLVDPALVVEVSVDLSLVPAGRWRHPVRYARARSHLAAGSPCPNRA